jgi:arginine decarboxylase-like protein
MVKIKYRQRTSVIGQLNAQRSNKFNADNLKKGIIAQEHRNEVEDLLQTLPNPQNQQVEAVWKNIKQAVCKAAGNILEHNTKKVRNGWYDEECTEILEVQNTARLKTLHRKRRSNAEAYKEARREARKLCIRKKKHYEEVLEELQEKYKRNALKQFYEGIRKIRKASNQEP